MKLTKEKNNHGNTELTETRKINLRKHRQKKPQRTQRKDNADRRKHEFHENSEMPSPGGQARKKLQKIQTRKREEIFASGSGTSY
jgi:hypothetical protein